MMRAWPSGTSLEMTKGRAIRGSVAIAVAALMAACGSGGSGGGGAEGSGGSAASGGSDASGGRAGSAGSDASGGSDATGGTGGSPSECPVQPPNDGDSCPTFNLSCTYGDSPLPACRATWGCRGLDENLTWRLGGGPTIDCETAEEDCPAEPPSVDDDYLGQSVCAYSDRICVYAAAAPRPCQCEDLGWHCSQVDERCPFPVPNDGTACGDEGLECQYIPAHCPMGGPNSEDFMVLCRDGAWLWGRSVCQF